MEYVVVGLILFATILILILYQSKQSQKKKIEQLRGVWGKPKYEHFDFNSIGLFANATNSYSFHRLTEQTIKDIDLHSLFAYVDRTTSRIGQQVLFKKLLEPSDLKQDPNEVLIEKFLTDSSLREETQLVLQKISRGEAYSIASLLNSSALKKPRWYNLLYFDVLLVVCLIAFSFKFPVLTIVLIVPLALNMFIHYWNKSNALLFFRSFPQLNILIGVSEKLSKKGGSFENKDVVNQIKRLKSFQKMSSFIQFNDGNSIYSELSFLVNYVQEVFKAFFLVEVFTLYAITKFLFERKEAIEALLNYVGNIDCALSVASLRSGSLRTCVPVFVSQEKLIQTKNLYHPLIEDCIKNDLFTDNKSILITGSNMSGKSTFLRALIINSILAQTLYTCFADEFKSPVLKQHTSIRIEDNLFDGKSYYLQEVNIMASLCACANSPYQNLFVLDEVFKGTNTMERIAAGKAILSYLNQRDNIVIVSTHDIELIELLSNEYDLYHFTETVENTELHFDHKIKPGPLTTRNAIKILALANYPPTIIQEAKQISSILQKTFLRS